MKWKKKVKDTGILVLVFLAAVIGFSLYTNKGNDNMTADMGAATYPQISFSYNGYVLNTLSGYAKPMDIPVMRDTVVPVMNQKIDGVVQAYENEIDGIEYAVYTLNGQERIKEGTLELAGNDFTLDLSDIGLAEERVLEVMLNAGEDRSVYFYTRLADTENIGMPECLDYIRNFHENAMGKVEGAGVGMALEPSELADNTSFQHVTIQSDYDHVSWGELEPLVEKGERWFVKEINNSSVSVQLEYRVRCKGEENESDLYLVKEFFRVNHVESMQKTYLLDYDRTMEQIFDVTKNMLNEQGVVLGIVPKDVPYLVNGDGQAVSFIAANELWNYNKETDEMSLVFSFADVENSDVRNMGTAYKLKLLGMDEKGDTTFAVCGYMSRGEHEGEVGVAVYYYDIEKNSVEERVFISSSQSYGIAVNELSSMVYYSVEENLLYVMIDGTLYEYDVRHGWMQTLVEGLQDAQYVVSEDGRLAAWQDGEELNTASRVIIRDFETGEERVVECKEDECIRPLGFIKHDFVYGIARTEDTGRTLSGEVTVPMYQIEIRDGKDKVVKTYQADGLYVLDASFDENMITLDRAVRDGDTYAATAPDYITNNEEKEESNIFVETYATELKEQQVRLTFDDGISDKKPKVLKPKQIVRDDSGVISFDDISNADKYYVYGYGELQGIYDKAGRAIQKAEEYRGVVVDSEQQYIWVRGNSVQQHNVAGKEEVIRTMVNRLRENETPADIVKDLNDGRCIDLTGCSANQLHYVLSKDIPVIGMLDAQNAVILVGYTENSIIYIQAGSGERLVVSDELMDQMTSGSGNTYVG